MAHQLQITSNFKRRAQKEENHRLETPVSRSCGHNPVNAVGTSKPQPMVLFPLTFSTGRSQHRAGWHGARPVQLVQQICPCLRQQRLYIQLDAARTNFQMSLLWSAKRQKMFDIQLDPWCSCVDGIGRMPRACQPDPGMYWNDRHPPEEEGPSLPLDLPSSPGPRWYSRKKTEFTEAKIDLGYFWCTTFLGPDPRPLPDSGAVCCGLRVHKAVRDGSGVIRIAERAYVHPP